MKPKDAQPPAFTDAPERGRGAGGNLPVRFFPRHYGEREEAAENSTPTRFFPDSARRIIAHNESPDVGFSASLNPYRGCEHGCAYCYARPTHEYLGYSPGLDFETKILVKHEAPELLRAELSRKSYEPEVLGMSGVTDCYQPVERKLELTRRCLAVLAEFLHPVIIITKNALVTRDVDHLQELSAVGAAAVVISLTTLDAELCGRLEPRASRPEARLEAVAALAAAGIPVGVNLSPIIPGLTDHEIPQLLESARQAGAQFASLTPVRLPLAVAPIFEEWLERNYPDRKSKVLNRIRSLRGGKLNDPRFGSRMRGEGL